MIERMRLDREDAVLLVVDVQEKLAKVMKHGEKVIRNIGILSRTADRLQIPILATEQYPRGLGPTIREVAEGIEGFSPLEKITFSSCGADRFMETLRGTGRKSAIVTGMETHVCVLQTVLDLLEGGYYVHVPADAVCSRRKGDWEVGLDFIRSAGAVITCTETVFFQLLKKAGTDEFKELSPMLK